MEKQRQEEQKKAEDEKQRQKEQKKAEDEKPSAQKEQKKNPSEQTGTGSAPSPAAVKQIIRLEKQKKYCSKRADQQMGEV